MRFPNTPPRERAAHPPAALRHRTHVCGRILGTALAAACVLLAPASDSRAAIDSPTLRTSTSQAITPASAPAPLANGRWFQTQRMLGSHNGNTFDWLGRSIAIDGNTALVGAPTSKTPTSGVYRKGGVYVLNLNGSTWEEAQFLSGSQQTTGSSVDNFGYTVALDGNTAAIAAATLNVGAYTAGRVYIYERINETWIETAILTPSGGTGEYDSFGQSLALQGDTLVVGAPEDGPPPRPTYFAGAAYVFTRSGGSWSQQARLAPADTAPHQHFGRSVALDGDTVLIGAPGSSEDPKPGTVYEFTRSGSTWSETRAIHENSALASDFFGVSVDLEGDTAIVGASGIAPGGAFVRGAAIALQRTPGGWNQMQTLLSSDGVASDEFGLFVDLHGDYALISAPMASRSLNNQGLAYLFKRESGEWSETNRLVSSVPKSKETFGMGLALSDDYAMVGGPYGTGSSKAAAIHVYRNTQQAALSFTPSPLSIGAAPVGYLSDPVAATLVNSGLSAATVSSIDVPLAEFILDTATCGPLPFTLPADSSCEIRFRFAPAAIQPYTTTIALHSDALNSPLTLTLNAEGIAPTAVLGGLDPSAVAATLVEGQSTSASMTMHNSGTAPLIWSVFDSPADESLTVHMNHSTSSVPLPNNTIACSSTTSTKENRYLRTFTAADFGASGAFHVNQVQFALETATVPFDLQVRLHLLNGVMKYSNMHLIGETVVHVDPSQPGMINVPVDADFPASATLVVELVAPDLSTVNGKFFPGSNKGGESSPSWFSAPACNYPEPVKFSSMPGLPAPVVHLILSASGHGLDCPTPTWFNFTPNNGTVPQGGSSPLSAAIDGSSLSVGNHTSRICLSTNAVNKPIVNIPLSATVLANAPVLSVTPAQVNFGNLEVGLDSAPATLTLNSVGALPVTVTALSTPTSPFLRVGGSCPAVPFSLPTGASCDLAYIHSPRTAGSATQILSITDSEGTHEITLSGLGEQIPRSIAVLGGNAQETAVGTPFAQPLRVQVRDALGHPMAGVAVAYAAPGSGASANLSAPVALTDGNGSVAVSAIANATTGSYGVTAGTSGGLVATFNLVNRPTSADVLVSIHATHEHVRRGGLVDYWITARNAGPDHAQSVQLSMTLAAALDASATHWICLDSTAGCTASGTGALTDVVALASGQSISWLVSAPVAMNATEDDITTSVQAQFSADSMPANNSASALTQIVLFRDGFEAYATGAAVGDAPSAAFDASSTARVQWGTAATDGVQGLASGIWAGTKGAAAQFRIERLTHRSAQWLRVIQYAPQTSTMPTPWQRADSARELLLSTVKASESTPPATWLLIDGVDGHPQWNLSIPVTQAACTLQEEAATIVTQNHPESD